jgi:peptide/nickel transport system permease protein
MALAAIDLGALFGGAIVTESIFAWPGVGRLLVNAVSSRDYPIVQAAVFGIAIIVVAVNLVVEILNRYVDPTLRTQA